MFHNQFADLDDLTLRCHDHRARSYMLEAIASYKAGAMRAAIISTWIAVAFDFIDKVIQLDQQGDAAAAEIAAEVRALQVAHDVSRSLAFERSILDRALDTLGLVSVSEYTDLRRLYEDRHRCAHPSMNAEGEIFQPTAEQVRYHIRSAVDSLLSQPPTSGKAAIESIVNQVEGEYFPEDVNKAVTILQKGPLSKARPALVRNLVIIFIKRSIDPTVSRPLRLRLSAALNALISIHPEVGNRTVSEKLSVLLRALPDEHYASAIALSLRLKDGQAYLDKDIRERLSQFISVCPYAKLQSLGTLAFGGTFLNDAISNRILALNPADFTKLIGERKSFLKFPASKSRAIEVFKTASSYDQADLIANTVIVPLKDDFSEEEVEKIVTFSFENSQIRGRNQFSDVMMSLRENPQVNPQRWDALLDKFNAQVHFGNLYFAKADSPFPADSVEEDDIPF